MLRTIRLFSLLLLLLAGSAPLFAASGFKAASSADVKKWGSRDFTTLKDVRQGLLIYIYDDRPKNNPIAKELEGADLLASAEVKAKFKAVLTIKVDSDGTNAKNWPAEFLKRGNNGAAILVASSDFAQAFWFDKNSDKEGLLKKENIVKALEAVSAYEKKRSESLAVLAGRREQEEARKLPPLPEEKKDGLEAMLDKGDGKPAKGTKGKEPVKPPEPKKDPKKEVLDE